MPPSPGIVLPAQLPPGAGTPIQMVAVPSADPDWQDVYALTDKGKVFHVWYRVGAGWNGPEQIIEPPAAP